ncbi:MAG: PIN domain-containing protein [Prevotella sp.]|jgi:predicted nucleic acid-binding protein|nr:PIN domain-containing protein [Prevotella sp.]MBR3479520.1 PIN domain-containing protein [Prevotella sp.]MBR6189888.1 PIN domain-containing protein [Prevotella sp.]
MMKVFLDTNILLDYGLDREKADFAGGILQLGKDGLIELYASYLSYANMGYILRHHPVAERYELVRMMRQPLFVLPCDANQLDAGLLTEVKDFEDMLQYQCALAAGCDVVVTNNKKDFHEFCRIPFLTSEEFLLQFDYEE